MSDFLRNVLNSGKQSNRPFISETPQAEFKSSKPKIKGKILKKESFANSSNSTKALEEKIDYLLQEIQSLKSNQAKLINENYIVTKESEKMRIIIQGMLFEGDFYQVEE